MVLYMWEDSLTQSHPMPLRADLRSHSKAQSASSSAAAAAPAPTSTTASTTPKATGKGKGKGKGKAAVSATKTKKTSPAVLKNAAAAKSPAAKQAAAMEPEEEVGGCVTCVCGCCVVGWMGVGSSMEWVHTRPGTHAHACVAPLH